MAPQSSASHPDDAKPHFHTVFVDTNLDTHLALIVSHADTVSDLREKIMLEHPLCFPKTGQIQIHAIKVKRRGYFYHLSDSMLVRSAFNGFNKSWFLSVDASELMELEKNQISNSPGTSNQVVCRGIANNSLVGAVDIPFSCASKRVSDFNCIGLLQFEDRQDEKEHMPSVSPCVSEHSGKGVVNNLESGVKPSGNDDTIIPSSGSIPERKEHCINYELPSSPIECEVDEFSKGNKDECNICEEGTLKSVPRAKEKHKTIRKKEDKVQDDAFEDKNASVLGPGKLTVQQDSLVPEIPSEEASREFSHDTRMGEDNIAHKQYQNSKRTSSEIEVPNDAFKETEVPKEHTVCNNNNTENNIDGECNKSMGEASEPGSSAEKKNKKRKRSLTHDLKEETLKVDSASQKAEVHKSNKVDSASQKAEVHKSNETQKKSEEPKDQVEFNNDKSGDGIEFQHDNVSQEPSDIRSPAKKKRKGKERSGDKIALKEKRSMTSDSNKETLKSENASQYILEDLPKIRNSSADQSTEHFDSADPLSSSALGSKRKRKKNSSNRHQTAAGTSSRNDDEAEHSRIFGEGVQEEIHKDGQISKDISVDQISGDNMEIGPDACKEGTTSKGNSKDHYAIDMKVHKSDLNEPKHLTEDNGHYMHESIAPDHCHLSEGQTEQAEEGREISPQDDPKSLLSENCLPSNQNNTDASIRELIVASEVPEVTRTAEHGKSEKKRRKKGNARDSSEGPELKEGLSHVDASKSDTFSVESHKETICNAVSGNTKREETLLNQTEGENVPLEELKGTSRSATDREVNDINAGSVEKISKTEAHAENVREKKSKKSKKKESTTAKSVSEILTKDQVLDHKESSPTSESRLLEEPSSKITKKNKSPSKRSTAKSSGPLSEPKEDFDGIEPPNSLSNAPKRNDKPPLGANETAIDSASSFRDEDNSHLEAPSKSNKVSAEQNFASEQQQHKDTASDDIFVNKNAADRTYIELMTGKKRNRVEVMKGNTRTRRSSSTQQLLSTEGDGLQINPDKVPKLRRTRQEEQLSSQSNSVTSTIEEKRRRSQVNKASGKIMKLEKKSEAFPVSNSKPKGFKKMVQNKVEQASGKNFEGVLSKKGQKKSVLAGTIFNDENSGSSEDEDEKANDSNSSTRTPLENSLSSDYSDGDSHAGSRGGRKGLETGAKSSIKSRLSGTKGIPIDSIIRSSSRYKKAKVTASQLEEIEIDLVPDSQVDL